MRRLLLKAFAGVTLGSVLRAAQQQPPNQVKKISAEELKKMIDEKKRFFFLDVREPKEIEEE